MKMLVEVLLAELLALAVRLAWPRLLAWIHGALTERLPLALPSLV